MSASIAAADQIATEVYLPQHDSLLLADIMRQHGPFTGRSVADLCTGSGVLAIAAARLNARRVSAFDICPKAVQYTRFRASGADVDIDVRLGSWSQALDAGPFDIVVSNPPYVPTGPAADGARSAAWNTPTASWNGGPDGRVILDPLCAVAGDMLTRGGTLLIVQSEFAGVQRSVYQLLRSGLRAEIVAAREIPFGPVLTAQAGWLEESGRLTVGRRTERLVVIRAGKP